MSYLRAIVDTVRHPLLVLTPDLCVETANPSFLSTFHVPREDVVGRSIFQLGDGQWDIPELRDLLSDVLPGAEEIVDYRVEHKFERIGRRVMLVSARRMVWADGDDRILLAVVDVTEQEETRRALESQAEFLGKVFDASREALVVLGFDGRVHSANETFYEIFAVPPEETQGRLLFELGNGQWDIPDLRRLLETILPNEAVFDDFEVSHEFETVGRKTMVLNARRIDHLQLILLAIEDVTERRRSRAELEESETSAVALVMAAGRAAWEADAAGIVRKDSPSWRSWTGQSADEQLGWGWMNAVHLEDRNVVAGQWTDAVASGTELDVEYRLADKEGGYRWTNMRAMPIRNSEGAVRKWVVLNIDIEAQRKFEAERELLLNELKHRIKNLFGIVISIAKRSAGTRSCDEYQRVLVGRLGALARAHDLALKAEMRSIDIETLVTRSVEAFARGTSGGKLRMSGPAVSIPARAGPTLSLALYELATNATKYGALSVPGGIVNLTWSVEEEGGRQLRIKWREENGPPVSPPLERSFGTRMIERVFGYELGGEAKLSFEPEGLQLDARISLE